ncbi:hypothetical protein D3C80_2028800 [compost metagenome]
MKIQPGLQIQFTALWLLAQPLALIAQLLELSTQTSRRSLQARWQRLRGAVPGLEQLQVDEVVLQAPLAVVPFR